MTNKKEKIILKTIELIRDNPNGIRYSELVKKISHEYPDIPNNTIRGVIWNIDVQLPKDIYKPKRGIFCHTSFRSIETDKVKVKRSKKTKREIIIAKAVEIIKNNPNGIHYSDLVKEIHKAFSDIPVNTIHGTIWNLETRVPDKVYKPARGIFRHLTFGEEVRELEGRHPVKVEKIREEDFYKPFADWLVNELEECTEAIPLGSNIFKDKWGTPDAIGKREPRRSAIVKAPTEIVAAEIKADTKELITSFGQACSYKLFSHKSYIVIPKNSSQDDISKLDALCLIFGIGLVLFNSNNVNDPQFEIRVRPSKHEPDMFYVNKYMKLIEKELFR